MPSKKLTRGQTFIRTVLADYEPGVAEMVILQECGATLDALEDPKLGDAAKRQHRIILSRLLAQLNLEDESGDRVFSDGRSVRAQRASRARWSREKAS